MSVIHRPDNAAHRGDHDVGAVELDVVAGVIDQAMLALSTYVGHVNVTNTYWYLSAVPELIALAAQRFESSMHPSEVSHA